MTEALDQLVRTRAFDRCEYCRMPQSARRLRFQIDHIIALQHGGKTTADNLALACGRCNRHKGPNLSGIDAVSGQITALFHPRTQDWATHFAMSGDTISGVTSTGRATVATLNMNDPTERSVRLELIRQGIF